MRVLLAGGGTAGHINPALAIADYVCKNNEKSSILFVGTQRGLESTIVPESGYDIEYVEVEGLSKKLTLKNMKSLYHMLTARGKCKKIIKKFKPDVVIGTGGYVCAPAVMAANALGIPTLIHEQNVFPGSAIKLLSRNSTSTMISFEASREYLKDAKSILFTGNPIRPSILSCPADKARKTLGVGSEKLVVIFGGSLGAAKINSVALSYIEMIKNQKNIRVIFATGQRNYEEVISRARSLGVDNLDNVEIKAYIHNMDEVMNAADVLVCRSGAITVSEICCLGKNSILVPSPNVTNNHQEFNARALSDIGAAITVLEKDFNAPLLKTHIESLIYNKEASDAMSSQALTLSSADALEIIYRKICELTKRK